MVNGKLALMIMKAEAWQRQREQIEFTRTVADIRKRLDQARRGAGVEASDSFEIVGAGEK